MRAIRIRVQRVSRSCLSPPPERWREDRMIGIVVVSHSQALAQAAIGLASAMVPPDRAPTVLPAAGLDDVTLGTDAAAIAEAVTGADSGDGVLVLLDLGSAVLSAEMALEFVDPELAARVRLSPAPLVEGLVAAIVTASAGGDLDVCAAEAERGLSGKAEHLDGASPARSEEVTVTDGETHTLAVTVDLPHGLHARPASAVVAAISDAASRVAVRNATRGGEVVDARSVTALGGLNLQRGDVVEFVVSGEDAPQTVVALAAVVANRFGEAQTLSGEEAQGGSEVFVRGPAVVLAPGPDLVGYVPGSDEPARLAQARSVVREYLRARRSGPAEGFVSAWLALLDDRAFLPVAATAMGTGASAPEAVVRAVKEASDRFARLADPYLRARAEDIRGLGRVLLSALADEPLAPTWPDVAFVAVAAELDLVTCMSLDADTCRGVVTWSGSPLGHGAILARERGIPFVAGAGWASGLATGDAVDVVGEVD